MGGQDIGEVTSGLVGGVSKAARASIDATTTAIPMTATRGATGVSALIGNNECEVAQRYKGMSAEGPPLPSSHPDRVGNASKATAIPANRTIPATARMIPRRTSTS
jgi:hypothetical protein